MNYKSNISSKSLCNFNNVTIKLQAPLKESSNLPVIEKHYYSGSHIGCDETGSGDFFGPLCVVACYIDERDFDWLSSINIGDPKNLSDREAVNIAREIKDRVVYSLLMLDNSHYNQLAQEGNNLANIKAKLYNQAITNVMQKMAMNIEKKVIPQFVSPKTYYNYLKSEVIVVKDLEFIKKESPEQYYAIICSNILSRYAFLQYFANMAKTLKIKLPRGTNSSIDPVAISLAQKYGEKMLLKVTKTNLTNYKRIINKLKKK